MSAPTPRVIVADNPVPRLDLDWKSAVALIAGTETYLLSTVGRAQNPHVVPVLGVWLDDTLLFNTSTAARKARHLQANPAVAVAAAGTSYDFTIEGTAHEVTNPDALRAVAKAFPTKYEWWHPQVIDGRFVADDSDVERAVYAVHPRSVFGFGKASGFSATRWTFDDPRSPV